MVTIPEDVKLRYGDDTAEWEDGKHRYRAHVWYDTDASINDYECYGEVSKYAYRYMYGESTTPRPDHFTGRARKIEVDRGYWMWWEPNNWDGRWDQLTEDEKRKEVSDMQDLLQQGFYGVTLERETRCEHGHWYGSGSESLAGIDSLDNGYDHQILSDMIAEMEYGDAQPE